MNENPFRPARRGLAAAHTLPETILAVLVIGTMVVSLYAGFSTGFSMIRAAREELRATQILLQRLEAIRLYTWSQLLDTTNYLKPTFVDYFDPLNPTNNSSQVVYAGQILTNLPAGVPVSAGYRTNMLEVTVRVYWTNHSGQGPVVRARQMQTYVSRYGMQNYLVGR